MFPKDRVLSRGFLSSSLSFSGVFCLTLFKTGGRLSARLEHLVNYTLHANRSLRYTDVENAPHVCNKLERCFPTRLNVYGQPEHVLRNLARNFPTFNDLLEIPDRQPVAVCGITVVPFIKRVR